MPYCNLTYIPGRLHWNEKPVIEKFGIGDIIYRRCDPKDIENPFEGIPILCELSHNIGTYNGNKLSCSEDVLFNIIPKEENERYSDKVVCTLEIKSLREDNQYYKTFIENKNGEDHNCVVKLIHEPTCCMYPHCVFRIWVNGEIVTHDNYKVTLKKLNQIRTAIRHELATMIRRRAIEINFE